MRFIRTKDGVYDTKTVGSIRDENLKAWFISIKIINDDEIIKQADTIEELCDCFVIEWLPTKHRDIFTIDKYSKEVVKSCIGNSKTKVYGAIWTDKGLIYVAKMNEKGVLELI